MRGRRRSNDRRQTPSAVVLAKARTHYPRMQLLRKAVATPHQPLCAVDRFRGMGPGFRQDDTIVDAAACEKRPALRHLLHLQHATPDLILLDRLEQGLEIALAESVIALALDELEEDRPDRIRGEDLQQHLGLTAIDDALAVDQDAVGLQPRDILAVFRQARVDLLEISIGWRGHERQAGGAQAFDS